MLGLVPYVDNWANLGSAACAFFLCFALFYKNLKIQILIAIVIALTYIGMLVIFYVVIPAQGWCKYCVYIDCAGIGYLFYCPVQL